MFKDDYGQEIEYLPTSMYNKRKPNNERRNALLFFAAGLLIILALILPK